MSLFRRLFNKSSADELEEHPKEVAADELTKSTTPAPVVSTAPDVLEAGSDAATPVTPTPTVADGATRPLPQETVISSQNEHLTFGQTTDVGMVRSNNQDSVLSMFFTSRSSEDRPDFGLFIVADGMGGHHDGEKASAITTRMVATQVVNTVYLPLISNHAEDEGHTDISDAIIKAVQKANADVIEKVPDGGTTATLVVVMGNLAYIAHVGDSRAYLITKDGVEQITRDHSVVQRMVELDQLTPEEATDYPHKNVLYRAIGQNETVEVDMLVRRLPPNSRLLICSDGLWGQVEEKEILEIAMSHSNPQEASDKLVALANTRGGLDNITSILLKMPSN